MRGTDTATIEKPRNMFNFYTFPQKTYSVTKNYPKPAPFRNYFTILLRSYQEYANFTQKRYPKVSTVRHPFPTQKCVTPSYKTRNFINLMIKMLYGSDLQRRQQKLPNI